MELEADASKYFNPRPPRGGRLEDSFALKALPIISIHALREEGDSFPFSGRVKTLDFNPRPPRGGRRFLTCKAYNMHKFQSTPSARRATSAPIWKANAMSYFNPRPPRGGRRAEHFDVGISILISIHALREEGDPRCATARTRVLNFNPRPPRGGRPIPKGFEPMPKIFQSTPSARRATFSFCISRYVEYDFNPRPPRGGRQQKRRKNPPRLFHYTRLCTI